MSARRLGRLLGATLALVALAVLAGGIFNQVKNSDMQTTDIDWGAKFGATIIDTSAGV